MRLSRTCMKSNPLDCRGKSSISTSQRNSQSSSVKQLKYMSISLYRQLRKTEKVIHFNPFTYGQLKVINTCKLLQVVTKSCFKAPHLFIFCVQKLRLPLDTKLNSVAHPEQQQSTAVIVAFVVQRIKTAICIRKMTIAIAANYNPC